MCTLSDWKSICTKTFFAKNWSYASYNHSSHFISFCRQKLGRYGHVATFVAWFMVMWTEISVQYRQRDKWTKPMVYLRVTKYIFMIATQHGFALWLVNWFWFIAIFLILSVFFFHPHQNVMWYLFSFHLFSVTLCTSPSVCLHSYRIHATISMCVIIWGWRLTSTSTQICGLEIRQLCYVRAHWWFVNRLVFRAHTHTWPDQSNTYILGAYDSRKYLWMHSNFTMWMFANAFVFQ